MPECLTFDLEAIWHSILARKLEKSSEIAVEKVQSGEAEGYINIVNFTEIYYVSFRIDPTIAEEKKRNLLVYGLNITFCYEKPFCA